MVSVNTNQLSAQTNPSLSGPVLSIQSPASSLQLYRGSSTNCKATVQVVCSLMPHAAACFLPTYCRPSPRDTCCRVITIPIMPLLAQPPPGAAANAYHLGCATFCPLQVHLLHCTAFWSQLTAVQGMFLLRECLVNFLGCVVKLLRNAHQLAENCQNRIADSLCAYQQGISRNSKIAV